MPGDDAQQLQDPKAPFLPRWVVYAMVPGLLGPMLILGFIFVTERAHDEARCPYHAVSERALSSEVSVREERRNCLPYVEEHRYSAVRRRQLQVLGRRRFSPSEFAQGRYDWEATLSDKGEVHVTVHNQGHPTAEFREGTKAEQAQ